MEGSGAALPPVALELYHGNIHMLIAAAVVLGMRYPAAWSFVLLSKVTPGVGVLWFLFGESEMGLAAVLLVVAALSALEFVIGRPPPVDVRRRTANRIAGGNREAAPDQNHRHQRAKHEIFSCLTAERNAAQRKRLRNVAQKHHSAWRRRS